MARLKKLLFHFFLHSWSNGRKTSASSLIINEVGHHPNLTGEDMETSMNKLKETTL